MISSFLWLKMLLCRSHACIVRQPLISAELELWSKPVALANNLFDGVSVRCRRSRSILQINPFFWGRSAYTGNQPFRWGVLWWKHAYIAEVGKACIRKQPLMRSGIVLWKKAFSMGNQFLLWRETVVKASLFWKSAYNFEGGCYGWTLPILEIFTLDGYYIVHVVCLYCNLFFRPILFCGKGLPPLKI